MRPACRYAACRTPKTVDNRNPEERPAVGPDTPRFANKKLYSHEDIEKAYEGKGYGAFKKDVADAVISVLEPIQQRYQQLVGDPELDTILDEGAKKAHAKANVTYVKACRAMGLYRK